MKPQSRGWHMSGWRCRVGLTLIRLGYRLEELGDRIDPPARHFVKSNPWWDKWQKENPDKVEEYLR